MNVVLYKVDGVKEKITVSTFTQARAIVCNSNKDVLVEVIRLGDGGLFLVDEEGKLKDSAINKVVTNLAHLHEAIYPHDYIVGDVIFFQNENDFEELPYE